MRNLSKIIFINSAHIRYAEVAMDGNVHFTGTQGVGKTTLLRALLFFYNCRKDKLGIRTQGQQAFDDFYIPDSYSYIIYEVSRGEKEPPFSIILFKRMDNRQPWSGRLRPCHRQTTHPKLRNRLQRNY